MIAWIGEHEQKVTERKMNEYEPKSVVRERYLCQNH